jgi:hypothetical protein
LLVSQEIDFFEALPMKAPDFVAKARNFGNSVTERLAKFGINPRELGDGMVVKSGDLLAKVFQLGNRLTLEFAKLDINSGELGHRIVM